ncbi:MAG: hypothetical protein N2053_12160 [Chitinispirillaceae bacterium]|nr:hypothetical protein [Chitinispirillaceae bacterium]
MERNKKIIDRRIIRLEEINKKDYIPFLGGRPKRNTLITKDEILDLKILLNTTNGVEEFLEKIKG